MSFRISSKPAEFLFFVLPHIILLFSCFSRTTDPIIKPKGYPRLTFPPKNYTTLSLSCPFSFQVPCYARFEPYRDASKTCWFNLKFPLFKATLFFTYETPGKNLAEYINDSHTLAYKHLTRATGIREMHIQDQTDRVFGTVYYIDGDVASACQFFFTDSLKHFLRGSLYFDQHTEPDSVAPIRDFLIKDVERIAETLRWKDAFDKTP